MRYRSRRSLDDSRGDLTAFVVVFVPSSIIALIVACTAQALGLEWRSLHPGAEHAQAVFGGVTAAVYTFLSHLK